MTPATVLEHDGIAQPIVEWALDYGITPAIIIGRLERGASIADAITTPMRTGFQKQALPIFSAEQQSTKSGGSPARTYTYQDQSLTVDGWSLVSGLSRSSIRSRLRKGWSIERILTTPRYERAPTPGVIANFSKDLGTSGGSDAQDRVQIDFHKEELN